MDVMESVLVSLGANVRHLRERQGWTQSELAHAIKTSRVTIGRIERGEQNVTVLLLAAIAKSLRVNLVDLFGDHPD